ncbi:MAG: hypothetical protein A2Z40_03665 [Deltaproteobacteria bacterium RBG_19FT_COMBO_60_16]|nr:MAG: hypothetical protein A2Z40_03665 [Deltaproteobacteria bacterium RBG_19FT_COMBO_60_16]
MLVGIGGKEIAEDFLKCGYCFLIVRPKILQEAQPLLWFIRPWEVRVVDRVVREVLWCVGQQRFRREVETAISTYEYFLCGRIAFSFQPAGGLTNIGQVRHCL